MIDTHLWLFIRIPSRLKELEDFLTTFESEEDGTIKKQYQMIMGGFGVATYGYSQDASLGRKFYRTGKAIERMKYRNKDRMIRDVTLVLDIMAYIAGTDKELDIVKTFTLPQTGEVKNLEDVTIQDLLEAIPPIVSSLDKMVMSETGNSLDEFRKENEEFLD
jgi:hypothetical protein